MTSGGVFPDDPYGGIKNEKRPAGPEPREVNLFHSRSDCDSSTGAQHHTLGIKHDQAAIGDHNHDGKGSRKIGAGLGLTLTGSKGGNVALANLLIMLGSVMDFTDSTT